MQKLTVPAALAVLILGVGAANAYTAAGTITNVDAKHHSVKLSNGRTYVVPAKIAMTAWYKGEKVKLTYSFSKGVRTASSVVVVAAASPPTTAPRAATSPSTGY
jgi:hypothetical protein